MTKTYARIDAGAVAELLRTDANPATLFHPALRWVEARDPAIALGWVESEAGLTPPKSAPASTIAVATLPTLAELNARVSELESQVSALAKR